MNLNHYKVFVKVAERGNFSKAGQDLFLSQPAVSQMMNQLEEDLGCNLFVRQNRGVTLTKEGEEFYNNVKPGIQGMEQAEIRIKEMKELKWGVLRLGASDTVSRYILPEYIKTYSHRFPRLKINILNGTSHELESMLINGEVEIVVGFRPRRENDIDFHTIMALHEAFVSSREYRNNLPEKLTPGNISKARMMMLDRKSQTRKQIDAQLLAQNIVLNPHIELANYDLLSEFAKEGMGVAVLAKEFIEGLEIIESDIKLPTREVGIYYQREIPLSFAAKSFVDMMGI